MLSEYLAIGEISKPQGVRGELKVRPITCDIDRFDGMTQVFLKRGETYAPVGIRVNRIAPDAVYMQMDGVNDRTQAEALRGQMLYVDRAHAVQLDEDATFICDLIGLHGLTDDGRDLGTLKDVLQPGGNDVYVFRGSLGEVLVPALRSVVEKVDLEAGEIRLVGSRLNEVAVFDAD
ncbi:MAG: 16S rRNA processing protein RimM [Clostridia bacterium]|nr:16S rRNA processing protein RimM [Clostridia bacterium]